MSLGQVAPSQQPSAPPAQSTPATPPTGNGSDPGNLIPAANGNTPPAQGSPPASPAQAPQSGAPDWRALMAGSDTKAVETLSRYQTPGDFLKSHNELRAKLSERQAPARLADNATPEQVAEYRKGLGLPDVAQDAQPDAYMQAYKIAAPEGYNLSAMEKGMVTDFAKEAYAKGWSPAEVKGATDFFFKQQAAQQQALNRVAVDFQKTEQGKLRDELGSKEYEAQVAAAESWLKAQFKDDDGAYKELLNAQLPNGGKLGDSAWFVKLIAQQAVGDGYTDRIEANAIESAGGKGLLAQRDEIEKLQYSDRARYNSPEVQAKLDKINAGLLARGEIDELGNPVRKRRTA